MTTFRPPICWGCKRYRQAVVDGNVGGARDTDGTSGMTCDAYPNGIPMRIVTSMADHRFSYEGDRGLHFVPQDADADEYATRLFDRDPEPA